MALPQVQPGLTAKGFRPLLDRFAAGKPITVTGRNILARAGMLTPETPYRSITDLPTAPATPYAQRQMPIKPPPADLMEDTRQKILEKRDAGLFGKIAATPEYKVPQGMTWQGAQKIMGLQKPDQLGLLGTMGGYLKERRTLQEKLAEEEQPGSINEFASKQFGYLVDDKGRPIIDEKGQTRPLPKGTMDKEQLFKDLNTIADNARQQKNISTFPDVRASFETARSAAKAGNSAGDLILMRMLAKITDPTTGVREEEYRTFTGAQGALAALGIQLTTDMIGEGKLTARGRGALLKQAFDIYNQRKAAYDFDYNFYDKQAQGIGLPSRSVLPYYAAPEQSVKIQTSDGSIYEMPFADAAKALLEKPDSIILN